MLGKHNLTHLVGELYVKYNIHNIVPLFKSFSNKLKEEFVQKMIRRFRTKELVCST